MLASKYKCYCCGKPLTSHKEVFTSDQQMVWVGSECYRLILQSGSAGYQPKQGGPRLYHYDFAPTY